MFRAGSPQGWAVASSAVRNVAIQSTSVFASAPVPCPLAAIYSSVRVCQHLRVLWGVQRTEVFLSYVYHHRQMS